MGTGPNRTLSILEVWNQKRIWILSCIFSLLLVELGLELVNYQQKQSLFQAVAVTLKNEVNSSNSYQISRSLKNLEDVGMIQCVVLRESTNSERLYYDTSTAKNCGFFYNMASGSLRSINGSSWFLSFETTNFISVMIFRLMAFTAVIMIHFLLLQYFREHERRQQATIFKKELESKMLTDLSARTKHDIASPLTALKIISKRIDASEEYRIFLEQATERIESILTDYSRSVPANEKIGQQNIATAIKRIVTETSLSKELPAEIFELHLNNIQISYDEFELSRILSNLINNSIEAAHNVKSPRIMISTKSFEDYSEITISDNGNGMSEETLSKLGQKGFSQGKDGHKNAGTGLGVYYAMKVISDWGGSLKFESKLNHGTTTTIILPT